MERTLPAMSSDYLEDSELRLAEVSTCHYDNLSKTNNLSVIGYTNGFYSSKKDIASGHVVKIRYDNRETGCRIEEWEGVNLIETPHNNGNLTDENPIKIINNMLYLMLSEDTVQDNRYIEVVLKRKIHEFSTE